MKSATETKMTKKIEVYRNNITLHLTRISGDIEHIKEKIDIVTNHLEKINGRLRYTENSISWIKGIGITVSFIVGSILAWVKKGA